MRVGPKFSLPFTETYATQQRIVKLVSAASNSDVSGVAQVGSRVYLQKMQKQKHSTTSVKAQMTNSGSFYPSPHLTPTAPCGASTLAPSALVTRRLRRLNSRTFGARQSATPTVFFTNRTRTLLQTRSNPYIVSQKHPQSFYDNFGKPGPILVILCCILR